MRRRTFLQSVIGGMTAFFLSKPKAKVIASNGTDDVQEWAEFAVDTAIPDSAKLNKRSGYTRTNIIGGRTLFKRLADFPDEVLSITSFQGKVIVFCKHSIWEIEENYKGELLRTQNKVT